MRHPYVTLQADQETLAGARASFVFNESPAGHFACMDFGGIQITTGHDTTVKDLADAFERLAWDLRLRTQQVHIKSWMEAHPEQPKPLNTYGKCQSCSFEGDLFAHPSGAEVCASCGAVEFTDELYTLAPDEHPFDKRMEAHDDGADEVAA